MRSGVVIAGYYGAQNIGDEAILSGMIQSLKNEGITDITVLSRCPELTKKVHKVESISIGRRLKGLIDIYKLLRKKQLFILGGGGLLQDYTKRVVPYWLSRVVIAKLAMTPVMYYAQGIGPLKTPKARKLVKIISNHVKYITLRDYSSEQLLKEIGVSKPKIEVTADPALAIKIISDGKKILKQEGIVLDNDKIKIGISLRSWKNDERYLPILINSLNKLKAKYDIQYVFFPFQYGKDESVSERVLATMAGEDSTIVKGHYKPEQIAAMLKEMDGVITMRLHALILSSISRTPAFALCYDPKVKNFMERIGIKRFYFAVENIGLQEDKFKLLLLEWINERENISKHMDEYVENMTLQAERNAEIVQELLK